MPRCWIIRHAQSTANAGAPTNDPASIPLTPLGHEQSEALARWFPAEPALVVSSPFLRTQQTAAPLLRRFARAAHEQWPIQEFTYLSPERFINTTQQQRRRAVVEFWNISDPNRVDGPGAESLAQLFERVADFKRRLLDLTTDTVIFGHGQFIQALLFLDLTGSPPADSAAMQRFKIFCEAVQVPNTAVLQAPTVLAPISTPHLSSS